MTAVRAAVVLPVKRFDGAKHRLADVLTPEERSALSEAMLSDVLGALARVRTAHHLVLVTSEPRAVQAAGGMRAEVVGDDPAVGHSAAAGLGINRCLALGAERVLLIPGDCPLLEAEAVERLLEASPAPGARVTLVTDRAGEGTNALLLEPPDAIEPAFGPGSRARHRAAARAHAIPFTEARIPSLRLDVDTPADLAAMRDVLHATPLSAPRTAAALRALAAGTPAVP